MAFLLKMQKMTQNPEVRTEIYFRKGDQYQNALRALENWKGSQKNKDLIKRFQQHLFAKGTGKRRVAKVTWELRKACDYLNNDLETASYNDIQALIALVNQDEHYSEVTKSDYRRAIKSLFRWYEVEDPRLNDNKKVVREEARRVYQFIDKYVKATYKKRKLDYSNILTDDDLKNLIDKGCANLMEKAFISVLHETGCRIGEILGIRLKDIERKNNHAMIKVDGKTGERRVPIIQSLPWLLRWIDEHPSKDNNNALLWVSKHNGWNNKPLRYAGIQKLLSRVFIRADIKKKHNPHWFRHSRATIIAPKYSEQVLCKIMGWSLGSKQVQTYVHMGAGQVEDAFLENHGLEEPEKKQPKITICVCGCTNTPDAKYCYKCGKALSVATFYAEEQSKNQAIDEAFGFMARIMTDPALKEKFEEYVRSQK